MDSRFRGNDSKKGDLVPKLLLWNVKIVFPSGSLGTRTIYLPSYFRRRLFLNFPLLF
jgi:hypothetical protein